GKATEGLVQQGFCVRRAEVQNSTVVFQLNISNNIGFCASISRPNAKPENVSGNAKPKQGTMKPELKRIRKVEYDIDPNRYELRSGSETNAPLCPYGNIYKWVVFDLKANEYVRFAKSVFKLLINKNGK
ncbi:MAG: hypothetical protein WAZ43_07645, partial [Ruminococcus bromii]